MTNTSTRKKRPDFMLIFITFLLLGVGIVMVFSSSAYVSFVKNQDSYYYLSRQFCHGMIGILLFLIASNIHYSIYQRYVRFILFGCLALLLMTYIPSLAPTINGAHRWLDLRIVSFQPSELVKVGLIIYTASIMVKKQPHLNSFLYSTLPPILIIGSFCTLILLQPHYSATIIILITCVSIMFCAGIRIRYLISLAVLGIPLLIGVLYLADYRIERLKTIFFSGPDSGINGERYQVIHSLFAIIPGGVTGLGLGKSIQKMLYLPEGHTDFIFAIIGEELGFIGCTFLIFAFAMLTIRGVIIAVQAPDQFGTLLAIGIVTLFATEVIFNVGVVTNILPVTGIPLPLISYGGTTLIIKMTSLGILLNISKYRVIKRKQRESHLNS